MLNAIAIVRTQGERTEARCIELAREQFDAVEVVRVSPFAEAVRQCMRIGMRSGREWMATIDADVLISPTYMRDVEPIARRSTAWQLLGTMDDKLFTGIRVGGVRLWRVSELRHLIRRVSSETARPEAGLCDRIPGWKYIEVVTGRHDYEQFYRDLHRKGAAHRRKHWGWRGHVESAWRDSPDPDLQAAYAGWHGRDLTMTEKAPL